MGHLDPVTDVALLVFVGVSTVVSVVYVATYLWRPWRSTPQGKALMVRAWGDIIVLSMALAYAIGGNYPLRAQVRLAGFGVFMVGTIYLTWSLLAAPGARNYPPWSWLRRRR